MNAKSFLSAAMVLAALAAQAALAAPAIAQQPSAADARAFMERAEKDLFDLGIKQGRAQWVAANFITVDTEAMSADATKDFAVAAQRYALEAKRFDNLQLPAELRRKMTLLKLALSSPPPGNAAEAAELTRLVVGLEADYGRGTYCRTKDGKQECLQVNDITRILAESRDPNELKDVWAGWHKVGAPMRAKYTRFAELSNKGARELGFANTGALWRAGYDMPPDDFCKELDRLWSQVQPLYLSLHTYVRTKLNEKYGDAVAPKTGMIPAHLLGNIWAQDWSNIFPLVAPGTADAGYDLTALLKAKNVDAVKMAHMAEGFFTSMGMPKLPPTFWERSLITKPRDREVVCHASAWSLDNKEDVRIKMCTEPTADDFTTLHHELGHNYYYLAYKNLPILFQNGANDGFHEAVGNALALAITPSYLKTVGLLDRVPTAAADTMILLNQALSKVAFLPFGLLIDQWRWKVFSGEVTPANYNAAWWQLRNKYQGVSAPLARSEQDFDPGAKYHVPANVPYTRYFLAAVLQFQFYRALCKEAGHTGPLYNCSFYGSKAAGDKLWAMLQMGASRPWQDVLFAATGQREMDASAMAEYFAPLKVWLDQQNRGKVVGW